jgi:hypothetical protein
LIAIGTATLFKLQRTKGGGTGRDGREKKNPAEQGEFGLLLQYYVPYLAHIRNTEYISVPMRLPDIYTQDGTRKYIIAILPRDQTIYLIPWNTMKVPRRWDLEKEEDKRSKHVD